MDVPTLRQASATLILAIAAVAGVGTLASGQPPEPASVASAAGVVLALDATPQPIATAGPRVVMPAASGAPVAASAVGHDGEAATERPVTRRSVDLPTVAAPASSAAPAASAPDKPTVSKLEAREPAPAKAAPAKAAPAKVAPAKAAAKYSGSNHVWIPALGISRAVRLYPCSRAKPLEAFMYRWGCAGRNNVYLMGHAYAPMKPLHDAYARGTLKVGMRAYYADGSGRLHTFAVIWWRVTDPIPSSNWAIAAQRVSSMTLQTCVGSKSQYRLVVRLVEIDD